MAFLWVMATFGCPTCHWSPQLSQLNWASVKCDFGLFLRRSPGEKASDREVLSGTSESLNWIKGNYLPYSMICFCLGRVSVLWSILNLVCSCDLCRELILTILGLIGVCHLAVRGTSLLPLEVLWLKSLESNRIGEGELWVWMTAVYIRGRTRIITNQWGIQELMFVTLVKMKLNQEGKILKFSWLLAKGLCSTGKWFTESVKI